MVKKEFLKPAVFDFDPKPTPNYITCLVYDIERDSEVWVTKTLDQWIRDPGCINLEFFGLHVLNTMRLAKGLKPIEQYSVGRSETEKKAKYAKS